MNYDVTVYDLEGNEVKKFYNFNDIDATNMYSYYVTNDDYVVKVEETELFYSKKTEKIKKKS
jgi:hypothetical protein